MKYKEMSVTFWDLFNAACEKYYDNVAVVARHGKDFKSYTYKELFSFSNELFDLFKSSVSDGQCFGLLMKHDFTIPAIVAAIHRMGCTFIFLNPDEELNYNEKVIDDFEINILISKTPDTNFKDFQKMEKRNDFEIYLYKNNNSLHSNVFQNYYKSIAYCIKTSGSTAIQKHVYVTHESIYPNIKDFNSIFRVTEKDVIKFSTPLTFDPSMVELYLAAYSGATLSICQDLMQGLVCEKYVPTIWQTTPSVFMKLGVETIRDYVLSKGSRLKVLALGGELFDFSRLSECKHEENKTEIFNLYGVTEVSCWASYCKVDCWRCSGEVSIGNALSETSIRTTCEDEDAFGKFLGVIEIGSLSRRCLVSTEKPNSHDVEVFFNNREMIWQSTGDIGLRHEDQTYFKGRRDRIIKYYGHRVNLTDIEKTSLNFQGVSQAACIWLPKVHSICLLIVADFDDTKKLTEFFKANLDSKSQPDKIIFVPEIPLSNHGKVSLKKVYDLYKKIHSEFDQNNVENEFLHILNESLNRDFKLCDVREKSFFDIGGDSILAMQFANKIEQLMDSPEVFFSLINSKYSIGQILEDIKSKLLSKIIECDKNYNMKRKNSDVVLNFEERSAVILDTNRKKTMKIKWKVDLLKCIDANPVLYKLGSEQFVLVGSHSGKLAMVETNTGLVVHMWDLRTRIEAPVLCVVGLCVVGGYSGEVWALSLRPLHQVQWCNKLGGMIKSQAAECGEHVLVATYEGIIWRIHLKTGDIVDKLCLNNEPISADLLTHGSLLFAATLKGTCACIRITHGAMAVVWRGGVSSPVFGRACLVGRGDRVLFCEAKGAVHCMDVGTGEKIWTFDAVQGSIFSSCLSYTTPDGNFITFGCHDHHSYYLKCTDDGFTMETRLKHPSQVFATPNVFEDGFIIQTSTSGCLQIVDAMDKRIVGEFTFPSEVFSSPVSSKNDIFVGCRDNYLYCLSVV